MEGAVKANQDSVVFNNSQLIKHTRLTESLDVVDNLQLVGGSEFASDLKHDGKSPFVKMHRIVEDSDSVELMDAGHDWHTVKDPDSLEDLDAMEYKMTADILDAIVWGFGEKLEEAEDTARDRQAKFRQP